MHVRHSARRSEGIPCANHSDVGALAHCRGCRIALCDPCCAFTINEDIWCEACGSSLEEDARPPYGRGFVVLVIGFGITTAVFLFKVLVIRAPIPYFLFAVMLGYAGSMFWAWNTVHPIFGVERPTIERRRPRKPLPRHARRA